MQFYPVCLQGRGLEMLDEIYLWIWCQNLVLDGPIILRPKCKQKYQKKEHSTKGEASSVQGSSMDQLSKISKIGPHPKGSLLLILTDNLLWKRIKEIIISRPVHRWHCSWCRYDIQSSNSQNITEKKYILK